MARLNEIARRRVIDQQLDRGVNIPFPDSVVICPDTVIGRDYRALVGVYAERNGGGDLRSVYTNEVTAKR